MLYALTLARGDVAWRVPLAATPGDILCSEKDGLILASRSSKTFDARSMADGRRVWAGAPEVPGRYSFLWESAPVWNGRMFLGPTVDIATGTSALTPHPLTGTKMSDVPSWT